MALEGGIPESMKKYPVANVPTYHTPEPNQDLVLFEGELKVTYKGNESMQKAKIFLAWLPSPRVKIQLNDFVVTGLPDFEELIIEPPPAERIPSITA